MNIGMAVLTRTIKSGSVPQKSIAGSDDLKRMNEGQPTEMLKNLRN